MKKNVNDLICGLLNDGKFTRKELNFTIYQAEQNKIDKTTLVDGIYGEDEKNLLLQIASSLTLSEKVQTQLYAEINTPKRQNVDLKLFKDDPMLSACLLGTLNDIISADGQIHPAEKIYFNTLAKDLGYDETTLNQLLGK